MAYNGMKPKDSIRPTACMHCNKKIYKTLLGLRRHETVCLRTVFGD